MSLGLNSPCTSRDQVAKFQEFRHCENRSKLKDNLHGRSFEHGKRSSKHNQNEFIF